MADPSQLCYLCDRNILEVGKASEDHPGVCWECDEKENPKKKAQRENERRLRGQAPDTSGNPLLRKPGAPRPAKTPLQKHFEGNPKTPEAPYTPPPKQGGYDPDGPNPLNG